jgi:lipopolysaccharide transport system ATP-binding protein
MPFVSRICTQAILLNKGQAELQSDSVPKVIDRYHEAFESGECKAVGSGEAEFLSFEVIGSDLDKIPMVSFGESLELKFRLRITSRCSVVGMRIVVWNQDQRAVLDILDHDSSVYTWNNDRQEIALTCALPAMHLAPGKHTISLHIIDGDRLMQFCRLDNAITFIMGHHLSTGAEVFEMAEWQIETGESS